jgi:hypothetical protein
MDKKDSFFANKIYAITGIIEKTKAGRNQIVMLYKTQDNNKNHSLSFLTKIRYVNMINKGMAKFSERIKVLK